VLALSSADERNPFKRRGAAVFLDEFRMMVFDRGHAGNPPEFTLFNTFISQDHPGNLRRFRIPMRYHKSVLVVKTEHSMSLGTPDRDGPLIVDPAQEFIVLELFDASALKPYVLIVLRIQALIKRACSVDTEIQISWEEWGRDAMIMEMPTFDSRIYVQGTHVVEAKVRSVSGGEAKRICLRTFDFSKRGCSTLWDESSETVRAAWHEDGRDLFLEGGDNMNLYSLGNGTFFHPPVSRLYRPKTSVG